MRRYSIILGYSFHELSILTVELRTVFSPSFYHFALIIHYILILVLDCRYKSLSLSWYTCVNLFSAVASIALHCSLTQCLLSLLTHLYTHSIVYSHLFSSDCKCVLLNCRFFSAGSNVSWWLPSNCDSWHRPPHYCIQWASKSPSRSTRGKFIF